MSFSRLSNTGSAERQISALREVLEERDAHVRLLKETLLQSRVEASDALVAAAKEHRASQRKHKLEYEATLKKLHDNTDKASAM